MRMRSGTFLLYAVPSFWGGWASLLDFGDALTEYNSSLTGAQADYWALRADWQTVGADIQEACENAKDVLKEESAA